MMIYEYPQQDGTLHQGDIFAGLPRVDLSLSKLAIVSETEDFYESNWDEIAEEENPAAVILGIKSVSAIIISQDCDAARNPDITLCEIREFEQVERSCIGLSSPKAIVKKITQHARINQKWFYLPPDMKIGFQSRMAVDFCTTLRLPREDLIRFLHRRKGTLAEIARVHFRERLSEFYRRYPYDEWYPLTTPEFEIYKKDHQDISPYPWQVQ